MKTANGLIGIFLLSCMTAAISLSARAAAVINGQFNTSIGYLAGQSASGDRMTVIGAGAGGSSYGDNTVEFIGGAAGAFSSQLKGCVGIGYHALRYASNCSNVIAIGSQALANMNGLKDLTYINGQFYAEKGWGLYLTPDSAYGKTSAPIFYTNGVWTMNGNLVVKGQISLADPSPSSTPIDVSGIYDYYLDAENGIDSNTGLISRPKKTFEAIISKIASSWTGSGMPTVGVYPGSYTYPTNFNLSSGVIFKGVGGAAATRMVARYVVTSKDWWTETTNNYCYIYSDCDKWAVFDGFTFTGFSAGGTTSKSPGSFNYVWLQNCEFRDAEPRVTRYGAVFYGCVLENCRIYPTVKPWTTSSFGGTWVVYNNVLLGCEAYDSILDFGCRTGDTKNSIPRLSHQTLFSNCYIGQDHCYGALTSPYGTSYTTVLGSQPIVYETTVRCPDVNENGFKNVIGSADKIVIATNSLIAIANDYACGVETNSNKAIPASQLDLDDNYHPTDVAYTFYGKDSEDNRGLRNSILSDVATVLNQHDLPAVSLALKSKIQPFLNLPRPAVSPVRLTQDLTLMENPNEDADPTNAVVITEPQSIKAVLVVEGDSLISGCTHLNNQNDIPTMRNILQSRVNSLVTLEGTQATYAAVSNAVANAVDADLFIFYYSGHGDRKRYADTGEDESDGYDEAMMLYDREMRDNDFWKLISKSNGRVFLLFDCCYSETMFRLPNGSRGALAASRSVSQKPFLTSPSLKPKSAPTFSMICWSAGPENMVTYNDENERIGYFTRAFRDCFDASKTYAQVWQNISTNATLLTAETPRRTVGGVNFENRLILK